MNYKSLRIYSQNVWKNKNLTEVILETEKKTSNVIFIQEPPRYLTKHIPSPHNCEGEPIYGHPSHPEWSILARPANDQSGIPRAITYINKRLNSLQPMLRRDVVDHRDINATSLTINNSPSLLLNVYSDESQSAITHLIDHKINHDKILIMAGDFNIRVSCS